MEMDRQYKCKLYIPNQTHNYTHGGYTTSLTVQNKILEQSEISVDLINKMEQDYSKCNNTQFEDRYVEFETDRNAMKNNGLVHNDNNNASYYVVPSTHHGCDQTLHMDDSKTYNMTNGNNMGNFTNYPEEYYNMNKEAEDKLNSLIAERMGQGNDDWPLVQIPLDIKYEVFRRRKRGDAINEWSNAYDTTKDPLHCAGHDSERDEPVCC